MGVTGWWAEVHKSFGLALTPSLGFDATSSTPADFGLSLTPAIGMAATGTSKAAFGLTFTPQIGMFAAKTGFGLMLTPEIGMAAAARYVAAFGLTLTPAIGMAAGEHYARDFGLAFTPAIGVSANGTSKAAFGLTLTPSVGMAGLGHSGIAFDAAGSSYSGTGSTSTISGTETHTATLGADAFVTVRWQKTVGAVAPTRTVTYGGTPMTSLGAIGANNAALTANSAFVELFHLGTVPSGAQTVAATVTVASGVLTQLAIGSISYTGVGSIGSLQTAFGSGSSNSISATSVAGHIALNSMMAGGATLSSYSQTSRQVAPGLVLGDAAGAPTVSFTATNSSSSPWANLVVDLSP